MLWQDERGNRAKAEHSILFCEESINKLFLRITKMEKFLWCLRDEMIREIEKMNGITTMQLAKMTGITQSVIVSV